MYRLRDIADIRFLFRIASYNDFLNSGYSPYNSSRFGKSIESLLFIEISIDSEKVLSINLVDGAYELRHIGISLSFF
jgi:hypothetical protein